MYNNVKSTSYVLQHAYDLTILYLNDELTEKQGNLIRELKHNYMIPIVLVNTECIGDDDLLSVTIDYEKAGYEACKSLIQEGRKRIALFTTQKRYPVSILKENGYRRIYWILYP